MREPDCFICAGVPISRRWAISVAPLLLCEACERVRSNNAPSILFSRIPKADPSGSALNDIVEGRVMTGVVADGLVNWTALIPLVVPTV
jgi:hypothetical protein